MIHINQYLGARFDNFTSGLTFRDWGVLCLGGFSVWYQLSLEAGVGGVTGVPDKDKTWLSPWLLLCLHNN